MPDKLLYSEALENAVASVEIEGYEIDEKQKAFCLDFITGTMSREEFIDSILKEL